VLSVSLNVTRVGTLYESTGFADYRSVRHQEESNSTPASHPAVQFSSPVPVLVNQV
jgi:hypothetical protein